MLYRRPHRRFPSREMVAKCALNFRINEKNTNEYILENSVDIYFYIFNTLFTDISVTDCMERKNQIQS